MPELNARQSAFVDEYMIDPTNQTQAAIRAGYSPKVAAEMASTNLRKPQIKSEIEKRMAARAKRTGISQDRVLQEIAKIAFANMSDFADWTAGGVALISSDKIDRVDAAAIAEISESNNEWGTTVKIKLHDKKGTLELLGRHLGMFNDKLDVNHKGGVKVVHNVPRPTS